MIPYTLKKIGESVFARCISLNHVDMCDAPFSSYTEVFSEISNNMFEYCYSLKKIVIPLYVVKIGDNAFRGCENLTRVEFHENQRLKKIGFGFFENCVNLKGLKLPPISEGGIGNNTFKNCKSITKVITYNSVLDYNPDEFDNVIGLPDSYSFIGDHAFENCENLKEVELYEFTSRIGTNAFKNCINLTSINIPHHQLDGIETATFMGCTSLKAITIPECVKIICSNAFKDCKNLSSINIAARTSISNNSFEGCDNLPGHFLANNRVLPEYVESQNTSYNSSANNSSMQANTQQEKLIACKMEIDKYANELATIQQKTQITPNDIVRASLCKQTILRKIDECISIAKKMNNIELSKDYARTKAKFEASFRNMKY